MNILKIILGTALALSFTACKNQTDLKDQTNKNSYALGTQIGESLKAQKVEVRPNAIALGIADALNGTKQLSQDQIEQALLDIQKEIAEKSLRSSQSMQSAGLEFLKANGQKSGIQITKSGLQYSVEKKGTGKVANINSTVSLNYRGILIDGSEFDNSYKRNEITTLKLSQAIPGWQEILEIMPAGSKFTIFLPPNLAYGNESRPGIPSGSVLIYQIDLLEVK